MPTDKQAVPFPDFLLGNFRLDVALLSGTRGTNHDGE